MFKSSYPGHYKGGHTKSNHRNGARSHHHHRAGNGRNGDNVSHHSPSQLQAFCARATDSQMASNRTPPYEGSQESYSGQGTTPEATPTLAARQPWTNGNDSGFDSMNRDGRQCAIVGASTNQHFHSGVCVS